jgi:hypothetical protein
VIAVDVFIKSGFIQIGWVAIKQGFFALTTRGCATQLIGANAVGGVAMGANDVFCISHTPQLRVATEISRRCSMRAIPSTSHAFNMNIPETHQNQMAVLGISRGLP